MNATAMRAFLHKSSAQKELEELCVECRVTVSHADATQSFAEGSEALDDQPVSITTAFHSTQFDSYDSSSPMDRKHWMTSLCL